MLVRMWSKGRTLIHCWWECKLVQSLWKPLWLCHKKMGIYLPQDPAIKFLGIDPKEASSYHRDICTAIFIPALWCCLRKAPSYENCRMSRHEMEAIIGTPWVAQNLRLEIPGTRVKLNTIVLKTSNNKMTPNATAID